MLSVRGLLSLFLTGFLIEACGKQGEANHPTAAPSGSVAVLDANVVLPVKPEPTVSNESRSVTEDPGDASAKGADVDIARVETVPVSSQETKSPKEGIAEVCEKLLRRANEKCTNRVAGFYQSSCRHYLQAPGLCDEPIRLALECQYKAKDEILCAHSADHNCAKINRELKTCQRGTAPVEQTTAEDDRTLPADWEQIHDHELGFTVAMPNGATLDPSRKHRTWKAEAGGISYYVAVVDAPSGSLDNQAFVRTVVSYVGSRCQLRLKLHGHLELKGTTVVQYHSACPDKTEWHGMLHFWNGKAISTGYTAPAGINGVQEPYFYSFLIDASALPVDSVTPPTP